ncbi:MAG: hypothetical protein K9I69_05890 [Ignavibacteriales bacterium]|nr:hypothetical protein [Ignavibacteriales bacterium]MCF8304912.1 hypothetical protein [Ignavibacteriales bacterium]MCF8314601.1 hypothetical protein [Ignavibacteriales bacterium]MCF8436362.1 hypothetical protein [Ignavibacteriales bacterium]
MRHFRHILVILVLAGATSIFAGSADKDYQSYEDNLLNGLRSDNHGLILSCAYQLGELKSTKAVLDLMHMLRNAESCDMRVIAALSLIKIGEPRGVYLVGREAQFNDSDRVCNFCDKFYRSYLNSQSEKPVEQPSVFAAK